MIDLTALTNLFVDVFGTSIDLTTPKVVRVERLGHVNNEKLVRDLKEKGHEFCWLHYTKLRQLKHQGWRPVTERDSVGRPSVYVDRLGELVLVHRPRKVCAGLRTLPSPPEQTQYAEAGGEEHVRFTPESGHVRRTSQFPLSANSGHPNRGRYSFAGASPIRK
jgi:hypothetical protein